MVVHGNHINHVNTNVLLVFLVSLLGLLNASTDNSAKTETVCRKTHFFSWAYVYFRRPSEDVEEAMVHPD